MHYFSTAGIKHHDQGDKEKGGFTQAPDSRGIRSQQVSQQRVDILVTETADAHISHQKQEAESEQGMGQVLWPSKPTSSGVFPSTRPHLLILPEQCHQLGITYLST